MVCCPHCHCPIRIDDPLRPPPWCPKCGADLPRGSATAPAPVAPQPELPPPPEPPQSFRAWLTPQDRQLFRPQDRATARGILHTVVTSGTGRNAYTGDPTEWGKTGTTENNGDAWFVGATKDITVAVWVGHADTVKPMLTEYGGAPVDGGTIPALIFNDVVTAYTQVQAEHRLFLGTRRGGGGADQP